MYKRFPGSSAGQESACNAGDPGLIPGSGRYPGEEKGSPPQYSWASLVAQMEKNLLAMRKTWVRSLGWEDPLEKGTGYPLQYSDLENSLAREVWQATVLCIKYSDMFPGIINVDNYTKMLAYFHCLHVTNCCCCFATNCYF